ncbi:MAG: response regulator [Bacteroidetes bacterium]|jgi:DNA-binding response OmpR family regulator|nr:response regulator [Bacteroidota bacterium]MBT6685484.1 response regulator [Bacteroidota bacterium]MBT7144591.1 response regulator [Bacteroidota bacterium]MBT7493481.1 response regulator [Bacteroidota bacterium]
MKKKILVIDDEATIRTLLVSFLSRKYNVVSQNNGAEGLAWLQEGDIPDLIVCDVEMPKLDGYEFIKSVKASGYFKNIPLIMLSGLDTSAERVKCLKMGANDFIVKPFNPEELDVKIEIALGRVF